MSGALLRSAAHGGLDVGRAVHGDALDLSRGIEPDDDARAGIHFLQGLLLQHVGPVHRTGAALAGGITVVRIADELADFLGRHAAREPRHAAPELVAPLRARGERITADALEESV